MKADDIRLAGSRLRLRHFVYDLCPRSIRLHQPARSWWEHSTHAGALLEHGALQTKPVWTHHCAGRRGQASGGLYLDDDDSEVLGGYFELEFAVEGQNLQARVVPRVRCHREGV